MVLSAKLGLWNYLAFTMTKDLMLSSTLPRLLGQLTRGLIQNQIRSVALFLLFFSPKVVKSASVAPHPSNPQETVFFKLYSIGWFGKGSD